MFNPPAVLFRPLAHPDDHSADLDAIQHVTTICHYNHPFTGRTKMGSSDKPGDFSGEDNFQKPQRVPFKLSMDMFHPLTFLNSAISLVIKLIPFVARQ
jgi:hypothetical protein